ncbi:hypothetical protein M4I21_16125 [Cellulophaga sp. 20_2_10]|uniref:hypothetical protein n=1 Tax=Cellulophaga sp. 20_2_10 TaxID=2942476 RepID=UPI00201A957D|nr:hypothetical protein [Cellulophaga sp. 20_2_10]MCL5247351.1 hypothetical protein [Cellulophaga sp. 20_2_10]
MKLTKEDILNINDYLKKKDIKFVDVRFELIDHLVSEYESLDNYPDLDSFLRKRISWCKQVSEAKAKTMHWGYQKDLWKRVLVFMKSPYFYLITFVIAFVYFQLYTILSLELFEKAVLFPFFGVIIFQFTFFLYNHYKNRLKLKLLSANYLFNIFSLPHLLLYIFSPFKDFFLEYPPLFLGYIGFALVLNIAALVEVTFKQKKIKREYKFLKEILI